MIKKFGLLSLILIMSSCATQRDVNPKEIMERLETRKAAATWKFQGYSKDQITTALIKTFQQMDKPDVDFDIRENKILVSRFWTYFLVFSYGFGRDYWEFKFSEDPQINSWTINASYSQSPDTSVFPSATTITFEENMEISGQVGPSANDWNLLHDRVNYFLENKNEWPLCSNYRGKPPESELSSKIMLFCDLIGIEDASPENKK
jgi:hypothetical protein